MTTSPRQQATARNLRRRNLALPLLLAAVAVGLVACGSGDSGRRPQAARPAEQTSQEFGKFEVHYNALRTDALTPEVARAYDIERSGNLAMLNVSLLARADDGQTVPVDGTVRATARNLTGQLKDLDMRRVQEGASIYFIGVVGISDNEILVFDIDVTPSDGSGTHSVQFKREFFGE
jgi:hypothetical protein